MIWLRVLCAAIGRMILFGVGGLLCGTCGGAVTGLLLMPLFAVTVQLLRGAPMDVTGSAFSGLFVGCVTGAVTGGLVMGIAGLVQSFNPRRLSLDHGFHKHFIGFFHGGFWCLLTGFYSGGAVILALALARGENLSNTSFVEQEFEFWLVFCYFGGSLLGALAPDAPGNFWRCIKAILPTKQNGTED